MRRAAAALLALACSAPAGAADAQGPLRVATEPFVTLPEDVRHPEGLAADPRGGEFYVGTFDTREPASVRNNQLLRYAADGRLLARRSFGASPLTGLAVAGGQVYVLDFGASKLRRIDARFTADTPIEDVAQFGKLDPLVPQPRSVANPDGSSDTVAFGASGFAAVNGMVFDGQGHLYVSDSFQGAVYRIADATRCKPCAPVVVSRDPLLATAGALPFGANGLAFGTDPDALYVANAGDGRLLKLALSSGKVSIVAESLPGADGLVFHGGLFWVSANQADTIVAVDAQGLACVRAGEFVGIGPDGAPQGLLFPASTAALGGWMLVTNLALPLTPAAGDEWEERVTRWNVARFRLPAR